MARTVNIVVRFTPEEAAHIREVVEANSGTVSEFIRTCVNAELARAGDPEAYKMLTEMFEKGMRQVVAARVRAEIVKEKKKRA